MSRQLLDITGQPIPQTVQTRAAYTQPAVGANVTVSVTNARFYSASTQVSIAGGGTYNVVSVDTAADTMVLTNPSPALPSNAAPTTVIAAGAAVINGAIVSGYARILRSSVQTLVNGVVTFQFTGVLNAAAAQAWAQHVSTTAATGIPVCTYARGATTVDVTVTCVDPATGAAQANDDATVFIFLHDAP